jgi:N-acetylmuramoyl-L-alanine amidase
VAARENANSPRSISELGGLVQKVTMNEAEESKELAARIQASLYSFSARNIPGAIDRGFKKGPFVVLIHAQMPSALAEIGFLSNPMEEALLRKGDYRARMAEAIFRGISRYAESLGAFQTAQKQK